MKNKLVVFDLGGVLVKNQGCQKVISWSTKIMTINEFNDLWIKSNTVREFEKGIISAKMFTDQLITEFNLVISPEELILEFTNFLIGFYEGTEVFLKELSKKYTLATLSNTNSIHWKRITTVFNLNKYIPNNFPSHITGFVKPDRNAYENILKKMKSEPDQVIFFDDNIHNINTAKEIVMKSHQVDGISEVIDIYRKNYA